MDVRNGILIHLCGLLMGAVVLSACTVSGADLTEPDGENGYECDDSNEMPVVTMSDVAERIPLLVDVVDVIDCEAEDSSHFGHTVRGHENLRIKFRIDYIGLVEEEGVPLSIKIRDNDGTLIRTNENFNHTFVEKMDVQKGVHQCVFKKKWKDYDTYGCWWETGGKYTIEIWYRDYCIKKDVFKVLPAK